jgi:hypothetical protein
MDVQVEVIYSNCHCTSVVALRMLFDEFMVLILFKSDLYDISAFEHDSTFVVIILRKYKFLFELI